MIELSSWSNQWVLSGNVWISLISYVLYQIHVTKEWMTCLDQEGDGGSGELVFKYFSEEVPFLKVLFKTLLRLKNWMQLYWKQDWYKIGLGTNKRRQAKKIAQEILYWFKSIKSYVQSQLFNLKIVGSTNFKSYYKTINS